MTFVERLSERRKTFKQRVDLSDTRRRREDEASQIRKKEKDEQIFRRRRLAELGSDICENNVCLDNIPLSAGM
jgi:hypothetical protein